VVDNGVLGPAPAIRNGAAGVGRAERTIAHLDPITTIKSMSAMFRVLAISLVLLVAACGNAGVSDTERVWCGAHPVAVVNAGVDLGIGPSQFVSQKAAIEQATLDGDQDLATRLLLAEVGQGITASAADSDPHLGMNAMESWQADARANWERSCKAAYSART